MLAPTKDVLLQRISDELDFAWRQLDLAAATMARDSLTAARHRPSLQTIDAVGQTLGQLAVVLRSARPDNAVDWVPSAESARPAAALRGCPAGLMTAPGSDDPEGGQARVDAMQAAVRAGSARPSIRRPNPAPVGPALVRTDDPLTCASRKSWDFVRRLVEQLGDILAADGLVVTRYGMSLQSVDLASQILSHLATVVRSSLLDLRCSASA